MSRVPGIEQDGQPVFCVVPADLWERLRAAAEETEDIADLVRFDREDDGLRFPAAVALAIADGVPCSGCPGRALNAQLPTKVQALRRIAASSARAARPAGRRFSSARNDLGMRRASR